MWRQGPWKYIRYAGYHTPTLQPGKRPRGNKRPRPFPPPHRPGPRYPPRNPRRLQRCRHPGQTQRPPQLPNLAPKPHPRRIPRGHDVSPPGHLEPHRRPTDRELASSILIPVAGPHPVRGESGRCTHRTVSYHKASATKPPRQSLVQYPAGPPPRSW